MKEDSMIPMCWKCADAVITKTGKFIGEAVLTGCKACDLINNYKDAEKHCPLCIKKDS